MNTCDAFESAYKNGFDAGIAEAARRYITAGTRDFFICSDGKRYWEYDKALAHEISVIKGD